MGKIRAHVVLTPTVTGLPIAGLIGFGATQIVGAGLGAGQPEFTNTLISSGLGQRKTDWIDEDG